MKRPLLLPLAIALALSGSHAFALGLGTIQVKSKLNQPLDAEIPILQGTAGEAEGLLVQMAAAEDFDRVGLNRSRLSVPLEFTIVKGSRGDAVIKVTSKEIIREPFLDFLVEANWPKGRLLREYTVLLDPPVMAPATGSAVAAAPKTPERAPTQVVPESKPKPAAPPKSAPVAVAPAPSRPAETQSRPAAAPKRAVSGNEYTVEEGDTLSGIARTVRPDEATNINQLMLAMLKQNPNAFFKENINSLKRGAILRIPTADEVKAVGSASEAAAQVHAQIEDWRGGLAAKPTLVADTGTPAEPKAPAATGKPTPASTTPAKPKADSLELVPPKAGKDTLAMADRPGSGGSNTANELKSELSRTKEALTSREQEANELKSRVKELEETKNKSDRMITLQKSEIADLQNKLAQLQADAKTAPKTGATTAVTTPASTPATSTPPAATTSATPPASSTAPTAADKLSKEDIWGNAAATPDAKTPSTTTTPATTPPAATTPSAPATTTASTTPPASSSPSTASSSSGTAPSTPTTTAGSSGPAPFTPSPSIAPTVPGDASSTATTTPAASTPPPKPVSTTAPVKPEAKTKVQPLTTTAPAWYQQSWVKPAAIGAGALLVLAALLGMRKRKPALATERGSIAGAFGDSPLSPSGDGAMDVAALDSEEQALRDQLVHEPANIGLHLELLSILYAERNVAAFEDAAETMHIYVVDEHQPEWLEARAMGQELAPHNPLFADERVVPSAFDEAVTAPHATMPAYGRDDVEDVFGTRETAAKAAPDPVETFDFDLDLDRDRETRAPLAPGAPVEPTFGFDNLPPIDFNNEALRAAEEAATVPPLHVDEDEFPGEDGVGTKLDLAKAYLDMGDPEGARSMLEEVLAEGNDVQKGEARRLMAEIR
jgi:pilus assembly protein FimV